MTTAFASRPNLEKYSFSISSVVLWLSPPTNNFLIKSESPWKSKIAIIIITIIIIIWTIHTFVNSIGLIRQL